MSLLSCALFITLISSALTNPARPTYPAFLNLDNHQSIHLSLRSDYDGEIAIRNELQSSNNKRADLKTIAVIASYRAFNGNNFSIVTKPSINEKTCVHVDEVDSYMFMSVIRTAWQRNLEGNLIYIGQEQVEGVNCHVWKFKDDEKVDFQFYISIPKSSDDEPQLKRIKEDKTNHKGKVMTFIYDNIKLNFDAISEDKFKIDEDVKCS